MKKILLTLGLLVGLISGTYILGWAEDKPAQPAQPAAVAQPTAPVVAAAEAPKTDQAAPAAPAEPADESDFAYGTVISVAPDKIVISEYDYDKDQEFESTYGIDTSTQYENAASINELKQGDEVEINFKKADDKKMAIQVYKFKAWETLEDSAAEDRG